MSVDVAIIIAYFNASETIEETLNSLIEEQNRTTQINFKVIAIDDGSTDNSSLLVDSYKSRIALINETLSHTGTPAQARNRGVELAETKYVFFLDADDLVLPFGLINAVDFAEENNSDIVVARLKSIGGRGVPRGMHHGNQASVPFLTSRVYWSNNPMKLIRTQMVKENHIRFNTHLRKDSDQQFILRCYLAADVISVLSDPPTIGYRYTPSGSNLTLRPYEVSYCTDYLDAMMEIFDKEIKDRNQQYPLLIRNWEIEIARELIWKRLGKLPESEWDKALQYLFNFANERLIPEMLPNTSIRWRGIVGLIGNHDHHELKRLLRARRLVLCSENAFVKLSGQIRANLIRLKATVGLPKGFN